MDRIETQRAIRKMKIIAEELESKFASMVLLYRTQLTEEEIHSLRGEVDELAGKLESCASWLYTFGRKSPRSKYFIPEIQRKKFLKNR